MLKRLTVLILALALTGCATMTGVLDILSPATDPPECAQVKQFFFPSASCPSGWLVPYASGPASCLDGETLKEIKAKCPNF